jgi:hypothetical protein
LGGAKSPAPIPGIPGIANGPRSFGIAGYQEYATSGHRLRVVLATDSGPEFGEIVFRLQLIIL